jgi:hypothetical protein
LFHEDGQDGQLIYLVILPWAWPVSGLVFPELSKLLDQEDA